jgi:diguanylate cyclase (GGDEF)-like protein
VPKGLRNLYAAQRTPADYRVVRTLLATVAVVLAVSGAVLYASEAQRSVSELNFQEAQIAKETAVAMLARNATLQRHVSGDSSALDLSAFYAGDRQVDEGLSRARQMCSDDDAELREIDTQERAEKVWEDLGVQAVKLAAKGRHETRADAVMRDRALDTFLAANRRLQRLLDRNRGEELRAAALVPVKSILLLSTVFGLIGIALAWRTSRNRRARRAADQALAARQAEYAHSQARFAEGMQVAEDQQEGHALLRSHLKRWVPDAAVRILVRNNSADRLESAVALPEEDPIAPALGHAKPRSCLSVRLSRPVRQGGESDEVLTCDVCGTAPGQSMCQPLLVGGEVIGSVLVTEEQALSEAEAERIQDSVTQAAPVLANLRNLSLAERRASTDALTGLPNRRGLDDTLKRLVAHANRTHTPVSLVAIDLDHFKDINDTCGHECGDEVLAAFGVMLRANLRGADVAARAGGEEFVVVLPETDRSGAMHVAEHIRGATEALTVPRLGARITASFGVATLPDDALDTDALLRLADRALYAAKQRGRNRVEAASTAGSPPAATEPHAEADVDATLRASAASAAATTAP